MDIKEFLRSQEWAIYKVDGAKRKFFGDTFFGPMWKDFPQDVEVPDDLNLFSIKAVTEYMGGEPPINVLVDDMDENNS